MVVYVAGGPKHGFNRGHHRKLNTTYVKSEKFPLKWIRTIIGSFWYVLSLLQKPPENARFPDPPRSATYQRYRSLKARSTAFGISSAIDKHFKSVLLALPTLRQAQGGRHALPQTGWFLNFSSQSIANRSPHAPDFIGVPSIIPDLMRPSSLSRCAFVRDIMSASGRSNGEATRIVGCFIVPLISFVCQSLPCCIIIQ